MVKNKPGIFDLFSWTFLLLLINISSSVKGQYCITTLQCDSMLMQCDTISREYFNASNKTLKKLKFGQPGSSVEYLYNERGHLNRKVHRNHVGEIQKTNYIYSDSSGSWYCDSLIDKSGILLFVFRRTPAKTENTYQIEWFYKKDTVASSRQLLHYDSNGNELSNSTCYSADNCISYRFFYSGNRKLSSELWVLTENGSNPVLRETEEYYYSDEDDLPEGSIRFSEPGHRRIGSYRYLVSK